MSETSLMQSLQRRQPGSLIRSRLWAWLFFTLALLGVGTAVADPINLREILGTEQFDAFGLSRLTPEELARLEAWLTAGEPAITNARVETDSELPPPEPAVPSTPQTPPAAAAVASAEAATAAAQFGEEQVARRRRDDNLGERIEARIQGKFEGWDGKTLFRLDNGQIWQQRIGGRYRVRAESPAVEIVKGRFGYYLELIETGRQVGVRRLR